ncbi:protein of unknown function [Pseudovibrio ascidiaceicola]|uniref:DUF4173 domain-containing protein n=1 Tax=Pseudovibrio ascidiaceicola TaxID=285279 RepID=A0A1I3VQV5_9HYPH|nr:DUF4173 domain-containing protein [Pseudovibrio ascidiaceicola]SFJ97313.1 protein of unknown function [Pseudovibrio ascidiaceicola]
MLSTSRMQMPSWMPVLGIQARLILGLGLCLLADFLFFGHRAEIGFSIFIVAVAFAIMLAGAGRASAHRAWIAVLTVIVGVAPSVLHWDFLSGLIAVLALAMCALIMNLRVNAFNLKMVKALLIFLRRWPLGFVKDMITLGRVKRRKRVMPNYAKLAFAWFLPLTLFPVFLYLFSSSNPVIEQWLLNIQLGKFFEKLDFARIVFWSIAFALIWPFLRVKFKRKLKTEKAKLQVKQATELEANQSYRTLTDDIFGYKAVVRSLVLFNGLFAVQSVLDAFYLWGSQELPVGTTYANYAHKGVYTLIIAALLAALFVLIASRSGAPTAKSKLIKVLLLTWTVQTALLVVSCIARLTNYVDVYAMTYLRLLAIIGVALVLVGVLTIIVKLAQNRDNSWLLKVNILTAVGVLYIISLSNTAGFIAHYNVNHAQNKRFDTWYLINLGPQAIPAIDAEIRKDLENDSLRTTQEILELSKARFSLANRSLREIENWRLWSLRNQLLVNYLRSNPMPTKSKPIAKKQVPVEPQAPTKLQTEPSDSKTRYRDDPGL